MKNIFTIIRLKICGFKKICNKKAIKIDNENCFITIYEKEFEYVCFLYNKNNKAVYAAYISSDRGNHKKKIIMSFTDIVNTLIRNYKKMICKRERIIWS